MKRALLRFLFIMIFPLTTQLASAQGVNSIEHPVEVGAQVGFYNQSPLRTIVTIEGGPVLRTSQFDQTYATIGGRIGYNLTPHFALEAEGNFIPKRNFSEVEQSRKAQFLAGVKAGIRQEKFGIFAKVRPGVMYFSQLPSHVTCTFPNPNPIIPTCSRESQTNFALDVGGVLEYYPSPRAVIRIDAGDTIVRFQEAGPTRIFTSTIVTPSDWTHNFQMSIGVGFRF